MNDELLKGIAVQASNMAKRDKESGGFNFLIAAYHDGEGLHRMTKIEALIIQRLGEDWLNHGEAKDLGYGLLRAAVQLLPPDAVVLASKINEFVPTEKFQKLTHQEKSEIMHGGGDRLWIEVERGHMAMCDALFIIVQTPTRICIWKQNLPDGEPQIHVGSQEGFRGRMKMFGAEEGEGSTAWVKKQG